MSDYLVSHPEIDIVAKVTDAPSTEKARTTFLDFLERGGRIPRSQRHYYREGMATKRTRFGMDTPSDVELDYRYESPEEAYQPIQPPGVEGVPVGTEEPTAQEISIGMEQPQTFGTPLARLGKELSPIEKLSLQAGGI